MSPSSAQGQSMSSLSADERLDILLREHEREQQVLSAEHVQQTAQVFRATQVPQQQHFQAPPSITSASPPPLLSAAPAQPCGCTQALPETGSLLLETAEEMEKRVEMSQTLRETVSQGSWQRGLSGSGSGFCASRSGKPVARDAWIRDENEEMWRQADAQRDGALTVHHQRCGTFPSSSSGHQPASQSTQLVQPASFSSNFGIEQREILLTFPVQILKDQFRDFKYQTCPWPA